MHLAKRLRAGLGLGCCAVGASLSLASAPGPATSSAIPSSRIAPAQRPLPTYAITPERQALLNTIRYAEGTWLGGAAEGYRTLFGGGRFQNLDHHPEITVDRGYVSAAAGAYQFLPGTWRAVARELNLSDFRPDSQDQAALRLVDRRGALKCFDRDGLSLEVLARLSPEWASLPDSQGASAYGQPVKAGSELQRFYAQQLDRQRRGLSA